jgi:hypothetical protein
MVLLSDDMSLVEDDRLDLAAHAISLRTKGCRVPGLMSARFPDVAVARTESGWMVLVMNWNNTPGRQAVDLSQLIPREALEGVRSAYEIWTKSQYPLSGTWLEVDKIPPHGARLLEIRTP